MDEDQLANMLNNPHVAQQMNEMMNNDQFIDMMIQSNPMLRNNPNAREMVRSPLFRQMMTNPDALRSAARIQRMMRGNSGGQGAFPMPGVTDTTPGAANNNNNATNIGGAQEQSNFAGRSNPDDILSSLQSQLATLRGLQSLQDSLGLPAQAPGNTGAQATNNTNTNTNASGTSPTPGMQGTSSPPPNPFANLFGGGLGANQNAANNPLGLPPMNPETLQQMMQLLGMGGGAGSPPAPPDNRPPEERYAEQLRQLNEMGFYDFDRNVAALRRSGGSVQGAIEHLLSS
ncbi:hypothetical protein RRF57_012934 [Xylaria bambusicola]|uniref:UBA domain-containing protein n=1 Tax=Xylaria bambusicola TaxID=326684 RepID=A0AAN7ZB64_9PEZI